MLKNPQPTVACMLHQAKIAGSLSLKMGLWFASYLKVTTVFLAGTNFSEFAR